MSGPTPAGSWDTSYHAPVLLEEILERIGGRPRVLDGTLGGGGHSAALLASGSTVVAVDRDPRAIETASARLTDALAAHRFVPILGNYADIDTIPALADLRFDGILLDLGISSHQIDDLDRGFSFRTGAPLDMRMGAGAEHTAGELLETLPEGDLTRLFRDYGDEPRALRLAREVVRRRGNGPFATSDDLVGAIRGALGARTGPGDFARLFQALRIAVNDELAGLERALPALRDRLVPGGILAVIAYHSGEDRLVKHAFRSWDSPCICPPRQPLCICGEAALGSTLARRAIVASEGEIARNTRSRSARLRMWQRNR